MKAKSILSAILSLSLLLGVHNGNIALWQDDDPEPVRVFPYRVSVLPERDQALLEAGIQIESESRLHSLLEDYLS